MSGLMETLEVRLGGRAHFDCQSKEGVLPHFRRVLQDENRLDLIAMGNVIVNYNYKVNIWNWKSFYVFRSCCSYSDEFTVHSSV